MSNGIWARNASRPAAAAIQLALGYQVAHAVYVATRLGVADLMGAGISESLEIARRTGTRPDLMRRLLRALAAFEVVKESGEDTFELTCVGECLRAESASSVRPLILMYGSDHARQMFGCLQECVATGKSAFELAFGSANGFQYLDSHPDLADLFNNGMSAASSFTGPAIAGAYSFAGVRHLVDVGGGHGTVLGTILKAHPHLYGTLFDLPSVVEGASIRLADEDLAGRCNVVAGDMFDAVPPGADRYLLAHVVHNWDDVRAVTVLRSCRRAMGNGAKLVILDRVMPERIEPDDAARGNALVDLMMLVRTTGGRERTAAEFEALLAGADLKLERIISLQISEALLEAMPA